MTITIQPNHNVILRLPSGAYKLITISESNQVCSLGKFGSFDSTHLLGHEYGRSYEILEDKSLKILTVENLQSLEAESAANSDLEDTVVQTEEEIANNEFITDSNNTNQGLSHDEIKVLRDTTHDRAALIEKLKENNKSFTLKSTFSQAKYTTRKMSKFIRRFTTIPATVFDVLEYLNDKDADKIMHINQETLSYFLNTADIRPGCEYLVVDETSGLLTSAILERGARATVIHDTEHLNLDIIKYLPQFSLDQLLESNCIRGLSWEDAVDPDTVLAEIQSYIEKKSDSRHARDHEKATRQAQHRDIITRHREQKYDGLLVMSNHTPASILSHLLPHLSNSRKAVVYSAFREPLLTLRHHDFDDLLLMPNITEIRARKFQVLKGRTRPVMTQKGEFGYVYHAIKIQRFDDIQAVGRHAGKRAEKEAHRAKENAIVEKSDSANHEEDEVVRQHEGEDHHGDEHERPAKRNKAS